MRNSFGFRDFGAAVRAVSAAPGQDGSYPKQQIMFAQPHQGRAWGGFPKPKRRGWLRLDPIGEAIVNGLSLLGGPGAMQQARDEIRNNMDQLVTAYDTGKYSLHPAAGIGYFAAMAPRDHVVVHGHV